jgi:antitoxin PrlF
MGAATVTSKGQLTIPSDVRAMFGIEAGHKVYFFQDLNGALAVKLVKPRKGAGFGALRAYADPDRVELTREDIGRAMVGDTSP